jgi:hypothetical protein
MREKETDRSRGVGGSNLVGNRREVATEKRVVLNNNEMRALREIAQAFLVPGPGGRRIGGVLDNLGWQRRERLDERGEQVRP